MYMQQKSMIQKVLDDNSQLILLIIDLQSNGKQNECLEHQRTLHRNLTYLIQFDSSISHHLNNLPLPNAFIQTQPSMINGNIIQQNQSDQIYRTQTNNSASSTNPYHSSASINKPTISPQRLPYFQQGRIATNTQNLISYNNSNERQIYYPQQNSLTQQQWSNQPPL